MPAFSVAEERAVQGIALARFRNDHQELLFLRFGPADSVRRLLGALAPRVANFWEVRASLCLATAIEQLAAGAKG